MEENQTRMVKLGVSDKFLDGRKHAFDVSDNTKKVAIEENKKDEEKKDEE